MKKDDKFTRKYFWLIFGLAFGLFVLVLNISSKSNNVRLVMTNVILSIIFGGLIVVIFNHTLKLVKKLTRIEKFIYLTVIFILGMLSVIYINSLTSNNPDISLLAKSCKGDVECINTLSGIIHFPFFPWGEALGEGGIILLLPIILFEFILGGMVGYLICLIIYSLLHITKRNDK